MIEIISGARKSLPFEFLISIVIFLLPRSVLADQILTIKYRATPVDVDKPYFEYLNTSQSSLVRGAWYDASKQYMIIDLNGTNYHYCGLDKQTWEMFKTAESFGTTYNQRIKGNFDCRVFPVPQYDESLENTERTAEAHENTNPSLNPNSARKNELRQEYENRSGYKAYLLTQPKSELTTKYLRETDEALQQIERELAN